MPPEGGLSDMSPFRTDSKYSPKANIPTNFDLNIGGRTKKTTTASSSATATANLLERSSSGENYSSAQSQSSTVTPSRPLTPIIMPVGPFPPLSSVREIKEFDATPSKLDNFIASVEGNMAAYNVPLSQGGYVAGNVDNRWSYVTTAVHTGAVAESRANYEYGRRYCILLAERLVGPAREW